MADNDDDLAERLKKAAERKAQHNAARMRVYRAKQAASQMAQQEAQHQAARMRVFRMKKAASRMAQQELLEKLMLMDEEKEILQRELNAKMSCQQESLAHAAHLPPLRSPLALCVTPPRGAKHVRSPTLGSGNGREKSNKLEQHEKMSTPPTLPRDKVTPDKVTPDKLSPQVTPSSQRSLPSPLSVMRLLRAVEKVPPAHSTRLCTLLTVACNMCAGQESPVTADKLVEGFTFKELMTLVESRFPTDEDDLDAEFRRFMDAFDADA